MKIRLIGVNLPEPTERGFKQTFRALVYPNYRLWFIGQVISLFGTWMQSTAQGFLVYELTHSPAYLGYVAFAAGVPTWLFTLLGGVVSDRIARRTLLIITQNCMMVLAFILAGLTFLGLVQPWHIIVLAFLLGVANAFDSPARLALAPELVDRKDLTNAIALNATMFNIATIVGPATAGLVYAAFGPGWCFFLNGLSFVAVIIALLLMKLPVQQDKLRQLAATKRAGRWDTVCISREDCPQPDRINRNHQSIWIFIYYLIACLVSGNPGRRRGNQRLAQLGSRYRRIDSRLGYRFDGQSACSGPDINHCHFYHTSSIISLFLYQLAATIPIYLNGNRGRIDFSGQSHQFIDPDPGFRCAARPGHEHLFIDILRRHVHRFSVDRRNRRVFQ